MTLTGASAFPHLVLAPTMPGRWFKSSSRPIKEEPMGNNEKLKWPALIFDILMMASYITFLSTYIAALLSTSGSVRVTVNSINESLFEVPMFIVAGILLPYVMYHRLTDGTYKK